MNPMQFTQVIPRLRVLETRLLDKAKIDRMIDGDSANEALKVLQESEYAGVMTGVKRPEDYEMVLARELKRVYELMYDASPVKSLVDIMGIKYDYHNIKVILKGMFLQKDFSHMLIPVGMIDVQTLKHSIENNNLGDLNETMKEGIIKAKEVFEETKDPQAIDIILDNTMFKEMREIAKQIDDKFVDKYVKVTIDSTNIKTLLRVKKQKKDKDFLEEVIIEGGEIDKDTLISMLHDAPENISNKLAFTNYGEMIKLGIEDFTKSGSVNELERLVDNYIMNMMKEAKYIPFGVEPLLAYIYAKETEIKIVRIIMVGKLNNISGEVIRERLRDIYV
ncbi:V-type ATP synthase subunit C [Clostridium baratii]|uniref:V-type ATP synthase subunit C n=1 Tax=Clostridium baratii TaxID=1561 RepID=A0A174LZF9_9CLOT|nr:V-type ATP synthase subunit C [Clostridium baratii]MBS6005669.1 V-type ATP synthase subunit C [Clostridium baratii]MDU1052735.1 V-type ATP synthase subunit C [Clostridium baratii]MDU4910230.1 V-type ATP synthase subunit C [Clostridium baratii]OPF52570.1 ATP synthase subunit C [Clostridium baratii]OPF56019.1 V-type ATP synthase subunit C [Clostridium baratii]